MATTTLATVSRNRACDAVVDGVDAGGAAGKLKLKIGGTVAVVIAYNYPAAFGAAANGAATAAGFPKQANASVAGNLTGFDVTDSADQVLWSGDVGTAGSGAACIVDNVNVAVGQTVTINSHVHTQPA